MPRDEILSADAMDVLDRGGEQIVSEIEVEFLSDRALELFRQVNSPWRRDDRRREAQFEYSAANRPVVLAPFLLMDAKPPVSIPATPVRRIAEALPDVAPSQLIGAGAGDRRLVPVEHRHAIGFARGPRPCRDRGVT